MIGQDDKMIVHGGAFDAESLWRDEKLAKLPALPDPQTEAIVSAMDELLFLFCRKSDVLCTRTPMDPAQRRYLAELGLTFKAVDQPLLSEDGRWEPNPFRLLLNHRAAPQWKELLSPSSCLEPFAILDGVQELAARYELQGKFPTMENVRKVNSKLYSTELRARLGYGPPTRMARSSKELLQAGQDMLTAGAVIIKDTFGVSGKGNLLISNAATLERIAGHIATQEQRGLETLFLLEPMLDKVSDFSCQFVTHADGSYEAIAVQRVMNADFAYLGTVSAEDELLEKLEREGYFTLMRTLSRQLYADGYFGHVCVDSMVLKDGSLVPIVEINARKSMSLIKKQLDDYLAAFSLKGNLTYLSVTCPGILNYAELLAAMEQEQLLFRPDRTEGILPLSSGTFTINQREGAKRKGRLYVSAVAKEIDRCGELLARLRSLLKSRDIAVTN